MKHEIINNRIASLRDSMRSANIQAAIIPQTDPHLSEYLADHWQVRRWLSGFTGSAGSLVITMDKAFVWADSRYWLQAASQLKGICIDVMEEGKPTVPTIEAYLCTNLPPHSTVGIDGMLFSITATSSMQQQLAASGIDLRVDFNPADSMWTDRPSLPKDKVFVHENKYAGETPDSKIAKILADASAQGADAVLISDLAEVAWTLNIRSRDVESNPVLTAYLYLSSNGNTLYLDTDKLTPEVTKHLQEAKVNTCPYSEAMTSVSAKANDSNAKVLLSANQTAGAWLDTLGSHAVIGKSPVAMLKAVKNDIQTQGIRHAMERDGVALTRAFMEIEQTIASGQSLTEMDVADILLKHRKAQPLFFDISFDTIAGFGPHGAIVHYSATPDTNSEITTDSLLLIDSGANYLDGTTDITRTIALGTPTDEQRRCFTLVMQGHIAIGTSIFPEGTRGAQLDALARMPLWKQGLSYLHGTGHGVGHFLNVHEGPQSIRLNDTLAPLTPGMITSNEPGVYLSDRFGIRCENLVLTIPAMTTEFGNFYKFETLTLFPFDLQLFDTTIMSDSEIEWVNNYHNTVRSRLLPLLQPAEQEWLIQKTQPLTR
ncbi:MAG: aminopeptidase P family protein [Paramuribaculum sp.]|nr:aminopeptidase P family protein [Paramuribaculum sp.]